MVHTLTLAFLGAPPPAAAQQDAFFHRAPCHVAFLAVAADDNARKVGKLSTLARTLRENRAAKAAEIGVLAVIAFAVVFTGWRIVGDNPIARQAVVWVANVLMLITIWIGLRLRGQTWGDLGLRLKANPRALGRTFLQSIVVLIFAVVAFVAGSVLMANVTAAPEAADMSGYSYLQGNLPLLLLALVSVYGVSSFGEETIYRGFLLTRLEEMGGGGQAASSLAVVTSSVVFGLVHFDWGVVGIIQTTFMGLALAISYLMVKRNLWVLILAHAYMDTALLVQMYLGPPAGASA